MTRIQTWLSLFFFPRQQKKSVQRGVHSDSFWTANTHNDFHNVLIFAKCEALSVFHPHSFSSGVWRGWRTTCKWKYLVADYIVSLCLMSVREQVVSVGSKGQVRCLLTHRTHRSWYGNLSKSQAFCFSRCLKERINLVIHSRSLTIHLIHTQFMVV